MASPAHRHVMVDAENTLHSRGKPFSARLAVSHTPSQARKGRLVAAPRLSTRDDNIVSTPAPRAAMKPCVYQPPSPHMPPVERIPHIAHSQDTYSDILPMCERLTLSDRYSLVNPWSKPYTAPPTPPPSPLPAPPPHRNLHTPVMHDVMFDFPSCEDMEEPHFMD